MHFLLLNFLEMEVVFGTSKRFIESATHALEGKTFTRIDNLCNTLETAKKVASCTYEYGTAWGKQVSNIDNISKGTSYLISSI